MPNYVHDTSGVLTIHMTAADVTAGGIDLALDYNGGTLWHCDPDGNMRIKSSCIEEDLENLGEALP